VRERPPERPFARRGLAIEQLVVDARENATQATEGDLRKLEDPRGLARRRRRRRGGLLLLFERAVERVARVRLELLGLPRPGRAEVGDARQSRERAVER
jgi:hypothetical protein